MTKEKIISIINKLLSKNMYKMPFFESGFIVCRNREEIVEEMYSFGPTIDLDYYIDECVKRNRPIIKLGYHTHPGNIVVPSTADLDVFINHECQHMCIGRKSYNNVRLMCLNKTSLLEDYFDKVKSLSLKVDKYFLAYINEVNYIELGETIWREKVSLLFVSEKLARLIENKFYEEVVDYVGEESIQLFEISCT